MFMYGFRLLTGSWEGEKRDVRAVEFVPVMVEPCQAEPGWGQGA